jgi:hypothetical protein
VEVDLQKMAYWFSFSGKGVMRYLVHGRDYFSYLDDALQPLKRKIAYADTPNERA